MESWLPERIFDSLRPCPFCGGKAEFIKQGSFYAFKVRCSECDATVGGSAFRNDSYNAGIWNKRVI